VAHFLILGGPGETWATLEETQTHSRHLGEATVMARVGMRVYPGTPLHGRWAREAGAGPLPDLLQPAYYLAPGLTEAEVCAHLRARASTLPNWVWEDPPQAYQKMAVRLRARGVVGPLWSYFSMPRRLGVIPAARTWWTRLLQPRRDYRHPTPLVEARGTTPAAGDRRSVRD
jgi:hypothetical protein